MKKLSQSTPIHPAVLEAFNEFQQILIQLLLFERWNGDLLTEYSNALLALLLASPGNYQSLAQAVIRHWETRSSAQQSPGHWLAALQSGFERLVNSNSLRTAQDDRSLNRDNKLIFLNNLRSFIETVRAIITIK